MTDNTLPLDQLAVLIPDDLKRQKGGREEWIEGSYNLCIHLAAARNHYTAHNKFGQWCNANGFGKGVIDDDTRAAAIEMGRHPDVLRTCLATTERSSLRYIHEYEFKLSLRYAAKTEPNGKDAKMNMRKHVEAFYEERGDEGCIIAEIERELGESAGMRASELRNDGILIGTGEKLPTGNGRGKGEVLVHRKFATPAMLQAAKDKNKPVKAGKKKRGLVVVPLNRYAVPLITTEQLSYEATHGFPREAAQEINPETGLPNDITFMHKYGHGAGIEFNRRVLMDKQKEAQRLAPQLRDLTKALKAVNPPLSQFLYIPEKQPVHAIEPMPALEFAQAVLEIKDGAHYRRKVEEALTTLAPELAAFNEYVAKINEYVAGLKAALAMPPPADIATVRESEEATKH